MRMSKQIALILVGLMCTSILFAAEKMTSSVDFYKGNMTEAKQKALEEGKLFFVDFYANWCAPCKWMDETTFADGAVAEMLNNNYVSLKVDIDDFEGFELKQQYKVKYLPTILIFNAEGELIDRLEETMSPRKLSGILTNHHKKNRSVPKVKPVNSSPSKKVEESEVPVLPQDDFVMPDKDSYRIQVGMYSDFKNTFKYVNELKEQFAEPIIVLNDYQDGKIVYRIMMGEFKTKNEAVSFVHILKKDFGISAIVK